MTTTQIDASRQVKDSSVTNAKLAGSIALTKLVEPVIQADGGQAFTADQPMGGFKITGLGDPSNPQEAATKAYVDSIAQGLDPKGSVRAATTANITRSGTQTIDGVALSVGDRVLVKDQSAPAENGIYLVASGAWTRTTDADAWAEIVSAFTFVEEGTNNADTGWVSQANAGGTLNTTAIPFAQFSTAGTISAGAGLLKTGSTIDVQNTDSSLTINADDLQVKRDANGGIAVSASGIAVKPDATAPVSIVVGANGVKVAQGIRVVRETPTGVVDGANTSYALAATPSPAGSEEVFLNGILQEPGAGNDYTISGATITMLAAPLAGDRIRVSYMRL